MTEYTPGGRGFCKICGRDITLHVAGFCPALSSLERIETDPLGIDQHTLGAKLDAGKNRLGLIFTGFARALEEVGKVGTYGTNKYPDNGWREVPDGQRRYTDAMYRHLLAESTEGPLDKATGLHHAAHAAWNALARLELMLNLEYGKAPECPSAKTGPSPTGGCQPRSTTQSAMPGSSDSTGT